MISNSVLSNFLISSLIFAASSNSRLESTELEITLNPKIRQYDVKNRLYPKGRSTMGMPGTKVTKKRGQMHLRKEETL